MENHHAINGKTHYKWPFSIAILTLPEGKFIGNLTPRIWHPHRQGPPPPADSTVHAVKEIEDRHGRLLCQQDLCHAA
jgi:hypothetical protein